MIGAVWKPWYLCRPSQLVRRVWRALARPPLEPVVIRLPWGVELEVNARETLGRAIWMTGIYDLTVSETLWRLTRTGALAVDAGANVGYMTGLLAVRTGSTGRVIAFEPHPTVAARLRRNVGHMSHRPNTAPVDLRESGLSNVTGTANLVSHRDELSNNGLAYIGSGTDGLTIRTERLDDVVGDGYVGVLKIDVEGHEPAVLSGASILLGRKAIRHVVFEDHTGPESAVRRAMEGYGYRVFALGWKIRGPVLGEPDGSPVCQPYEPPSYLATIDVEEVERVFTRPGWEVFG